MAAINFADIDSSFNITDSNILFTNSTNPVRSSTNFGWQSSKTSHVDFYGSKFSFDSSGNPTGGIATSFGLDLGNDDHQVFSDYDIQITGLKIDLLDVAPAVNGSMSDEDQENLIWQTILRGNDKIDLGSKASSASLTLNIAGDGRTTVGDPVIHSGNDNIIGDAGRFGVAIGDFDSISKGSIVFAGNDTIALTHGYTIFGDARNVDGFLAGGNDDLSGASLIYGDTNFVQDGGRLDGGDDKITLLTVGTNTTTAIADVGYVFGMAFGGNDRIQGSENNDGLYGDASYVYPGGYLMGGNDTVHGNGGNDVIYGDWYYNSATSEVHGGNDKLYGDAGNDIISGNDGDDYLDGGTSADTIYGGLGNDTYIVDNKADITDEQYGGGTDIVKSSVTWKLASGFENLTLTGTSKINGTGTSGNNVITGNTAHNVLTGGGGSDTFVFNTALVSANYDTITDFDHTTDRFNIDNAVFKGLTAGTLAANDFKLISSATSTAGVDSSDRILYDRDHGNLYFDQDGSKTGHSRILFAHVDNGTLLNNTDFHII